MNTTDILEWLASVKSHLGEAGPPPVTPLARKKAGLKPLKGVKAKPPPVPTRSGRGRPEVPKVSKRGRGALPPPTPGKVAAHAAKLKKSGQISGKLSPEQQGAHAKRMAKADLQKQQRSKMTGDTFTSKGLGIKRAYKMHTVGRAKPAKSDDEKKLRQVRSQMQKSVGRVVQKKRDLGAAKESLSLLAYKYRVLSEA